MLISLVHTGGLDIELYLHCDDDGGNIDNRLTSVLICDKERML